MGDISVQEEKVSRLNVIGSIVYDMCSGSVNNKTHFYKVMGMHGAAHIYRCFMNVDIAFVFLQKFGCVQCSVFHSNPFWQATVPARRAFSACGLRIGGIKKAAATNGLPQPVFPGMQTDMPEKACEFKLSLFVGLLTRAAEESSEYSETSRLCQPSRRIPVTDFHRMAETVRIQRRSPSGIHTRFPLFISADRTPQSHKKLDRYKYTAKRRVVSGGGSMYSLRVLFLTDNVNGV